MDPESNATLALLNPTKTITLTERVKTYLQDQVEYLSKQVWSNLVWIASSVVVKEFGLEPTFEEVKLEAFAIAMAPDEAVFDRELLDRQEREEMAEPGNAADEVRVQGMQRARAGMYGTKRGLTGKQYNSVIMNSEFVVTNLAVLQDLKDIGFESTTSQEDKYMAAIQDRRERLTNWKRNSDQAAEVQHAKNLATGRKAAEQCSVL